MAKKLKPMHPGEVLREEFLAPLEISAGAFAKACGLPRTRIERIAGEQGGVSADTALRLAKALGTTPQLWLNLQNDYDVEIARRGLGKILDRIETVNKPRAAWSAPNGRSRDLRTAHRLAPERRICSEGESVGR